VHCEFPLPAAGADMYEAEEIESGWFLPLLLRVFFRRSPKVHRAGLLRAERQTSARKSSCLDLDHLLNILPIPPLSSLHVLQFHSLQSVPFSPVSKWGFGPVEMQLALDFESPSFHISVATRDSHVQKISHATHFNLLVLGYALARIWSRSESALLADAFRGSAFGPNHLAKA
jgi:hypothetical protein